MLVSSYAVFSHMQLRIKTGAFYIRDTKNRLPFLTVILNNVIMKALARFHQLKIEFGN